MIGRPEYIVKLRCPVDPSDQDGVRRLRNSLKAMLRRYGWRCVEVRPASANTSDEEAVTTENTGGNEGLA
jgi:hypothetical protein